MVRLHGEDGTFDPEWVVDYWSSRAVLVLSLGFVAAAGLFVAVPMAEGGGRRSASEPLDVSVLSTDSSFASDGPGHHE